MPFLELRRVRKSFRSAKGRRVVLRDLSLSIEEGEFVAIVGGSGSGKTTLVSLVAGLMVPDSGEILRNGAPVGAPGPDRGVVFQNHSLLPWLSVYENVRLAVDAVCGQGSEAERHERTLDALRTVQLEAALAKRPAQLSGGMRQRVAVARALALSPELLLLDEPFSALDALTRSALQQELARLWLEDRKTVLLITNDTEEAMLLADRIVPLAGDGAGATLAAPIPVDIPRPRFARRLAEEPGYRRARVAIMDWLAGRGRHTPATAPPLCEAPGAPALLAE
jgi:nitrate/nitrite transport system ATP-binding protein